MYVNATKAVITVVATFAIQTFLENTAARRDGTLILTTVNPKGIYYVPNPGRTAKTVMPQQLATLNQSAMGIVELQQDIFYISTTDQMQGGGNHLWRLDMRKFSPRNNSTKLTHIAAFPHNALVLNGSVRLSKNVILCADSWAGLIWKVDIPANGAAPLISVWLEHALFAHNPDPVKVDAPGVNGLKYNEKTKKLYFSNTSYMIFGVVNVDPDTLEPAREPETVMENWMQADDFILDVDANVAYITTHRQNSIVKVELATGVNTTVAGDPFNIDMIGPTSGAWNGGLRQGGKWAYFVTDGGIKNPYDGTVREAKVLRVDFSEESLLKRPPLS